MEHELLALRAELAALNQEFTQKSRALELRVNELEQRLTHTDSLSTDTHSTTLSNSAISDVAATEPSYVVNVSNTGSPNVIAPSQRDGATIVREAEHRESRRIGIIQQRLFLSIMPLLGPIGRLWEYISGSYEYYRNQGKAPVFFMTVTGIVTLVFGFGYLLQFSFNEFLNPVAKVGLGFILAVSSVIGGVHFTQRRQDMAEYGSSLIALGVILNYLCAYFSGPYYHLLPEILSFLLLATITAIAYYLALLFETRIVAIVTLLGGATMPLVANHIDTSPSLYLSYLLVLSSAMLHLSRKIRWQQLAYISIALSAGMIENAIINPITGKHEVVFLIAIVHGFFYVFSFYALQGLNTREMEVRSRLIIVSSTILFFLFSMQQLITDNSVLGWVYLFNVLPWMVIMFGTNKIFHYLADDDEYRIVQAIALLHIGLLAGVGILVLCSAQVAGIVWCVESFVLIYLGARFGFLSVRIEGFIALLVASITMLIQVVLWIMNSIVPAPELFNLSFNTGWINLIAMTVLMYAVASLLDKQVPSLTSLEVRLTTMMKNAYSVLLSLSFLLSVAIFWAQGVWLLAIIPLFYFIYTSQKTSSAFTENFALLHYFLLIIPFFVSANTVGNFHFSEQSLYGQVARVEAFLTLWLIAEFYKRFCENSNHRMFSENLRKLFYCIIPVFFLPSVLRRYSDFFPLSLWLSSGIALFLYYRLQFYILQLELRLLVYTASIVTVCSAVLHHFDVWQGKVTEAIFSGLIFYGFIIWRWKGLQRRLLTSDVHEQCHKSFKPLFSTAVYYIGVAAFIIIYSVTNNIELSVIITLLLFTGLFLSRPPIAPVRSNLRIAYIIVVFLFILLTLLHVYSVFSRSGSMSVVMLGVYNVVAVLCMAVLVYHPRAAMLALWRRAGGQLFNICLFNIMTIIVYVSLLKQCFSTMLGPAISISLVIHATIILFQTIKPKMKKLLPLSIILYSVSALKIIFFDMQNYSLLQKMIVFMLIGLCMLGAAFKFQKMTSQLPE